MLWLGVRFSGILNHKDDFNFKVHSIDDFHHCVDFDHTCEHHNDFDYFDYFCNANA